MYMFFEYNNKLLKQLFIELYFLFILFFNLFFSFQFVRKSLSLIPTYDKHFLNSFWF